MALYETLRAIDVIGPAEGHIEAMGYVLHPDGKIRPANPWHLITNTPWISSKVCPVRNCKKWQKIYFGIYRMISRNCFNCYKIVVKPKTLEELFLLYDLQKKQSEDPDFIACKCGMEMRPRVKLKGLWGGYYYTPLGEGIELAREWYKRIERDVHRALGHDTKVFLKRACTEMEEDAGPSDKWVYPEVQHMMEDLLDVTWVCPYQTTVEPDVLRTTIMKRWIEYGLSNRDPATKEYYADLDSFGVSEYTVYHDTKIDMDDPKLGIVLEEEKEKKEEKDGSKILRLSAN